MTNLCQNWHRYWFTPETAEQLALVRVVSYGLLFAIYLPLDDRKSTQVSPVFWMPISAFHFLSGPPRNAATIGVLQILWKASLVTSAIDRKSTQVSPVFWMPISAFHFLSGPPRNAATIGVLQILWKASLVTSA